MQRRQAFPGGFRPSSCGAAAAHRVRPFVLSSTARPHASGTSGTSAQVPSLTQSLAGPVTQSLTNGKRAGCRSRRRGGRCQQALRLSYTTLFFSFFFCFFTLVTGPRRSLSLKLSDTKIYEPPMRACLGTTPRSLTAKPRASGSGTSAWGPGLGVYLLGLGLGSQTRGVPRGDFTYEQHPETSFSKRQREQLMLLAFRLQ